MSIFVDNQCYTVLNDLLDSSKKLRKETQIDKSQKGLCERSDENPFWFFLFLNSLILVLIQIERRENMCEANAYLLRDGEEELIMKSVDILRPETNGIYLQDIFGGQRTIKARIREMNLVDHRILLEEE